jgi:hypothetical protein
LLCFACIGRTRGSSSSPLIRGLRAPRMSWNKALITWWSSKAWSSRTLFPSCLEALRMRGSRSPGSELRPTALAPREDSEANDVNGDIGNASTFAVPPEQQALGTSGIEACVHDVVGDCGDFEVVIPGVPSQGLEGSVHGQTIALGEDTLGLLDRDSARQRIL